MPNSLVPPKAPTIPSDAMAALEQVGESAVRAMLNSGKAGYGPGADVPVGANFVTRAYVEQWLHWKDRRTAYWNKIGIVSAVLAAVFSFIALWK